MPSSSPLISVIIPACNQGMYIADAIQSVLDQSYRNLEVLIVDDGSTDDTRSIVAKFSDPRLHYLYQENRGLSAARNLGIHHSKGSYLSFLDSDDLFLPNKLRLLLKQMESHHSSGLVAGQAIPFDQSGQHPDKIYATALPLDSAQLLLGNPLHVGSVLLRRSWQERAGFFDESLRSYEDWDMWLRLAKIGCPMSCVAQPVSLYRFHRDQMTGNSEQMSQATFAVLYKVFSDPSIPPNWQTMHDQAYANAYLRTAAQAYHVQNFEHGMNCIAKAVQLNPNLLDNEAEPLVNRFHAWANSPKIVDTLTYLEDIYNNLPGELAGLQDRQREELGRAAMQKALESYERGDLAVTRSVSLKAFFYHSRWLRDRGALSIALRAWLQLLIPRWT